MKAFMALALMSLLVIALQAQTAKVIELTPEESKHAVKLDQERKALEKEDQDFRYDVAIHHKIAVEYPTTASMCIVPKGEIACDPGPAPKSDHRSVDYKPEWYGGFEYSEDYRFIVPAKTPAPSSNICIGFGCGYPYNTTNPVLSGTPIGPTSY